MFFSSRYCPPLALAFKHIHFLAAAARSSLSSRSGFSSCDLCWQFLSSERSAFLFLRSDLLLPTNRLVVPASGW